MKTTYFESPLGNLRLIFSDDEVLYEIQFAQGAKSLSDAADAKSKPTPTQKKVISQLGNFFSGKKTNFKINFSTEGTKFQKQVWDAIYSIPYGETASYKEIAEMVGRPKAYRAVANACGRNQLPILIPCHRVVGSNGIGGYSSGLVKKKKLMEIEGIEF
jgi:methylated-DNA-[protein]-cysteine S-methyltransferase